MAFEKIKIEKRKNVGKIIFNRPEKLNAYDRNLSEELKQGVSDFCKDESVSVIVITGAGNAFMAGADIGMINGWIAEGEVKRIKKALSAMFNPNMLENCPKPTIAAVNGLAFGMGCEVAMACDFRIAASNAKFALPEIKLGLIPGGGGSQRLLRLVGATRALELIATGDPIDADEAYRIGLVNQVVESEDLWPAVDALTSRLTDKGALALQACKKLIYQGGDLPMYQAIDYERDIFSEILLTDDAAEGTMAFLEKRKAVFKGRYPGNEIPT